MKSVATKIWGRPVSIDYSPKLGEELYTSITRKVHSPVSAVWESIFYKCVDVLDEKCSY